MIEKAVEEFTAVVDEVEAEHAMQYKLLAEAERLIEHAELETAQAMVQQLYDYSEAHFGSEQVLMRLYSYPAYQAHLREHGDLLAALGQIRDEMKTGAPAMSAAAIRRWLTAHIHHSDRAFLEFVRGISPGVEAL